MLWVLASAWGVPQMPLFKPAVIIGITAALMTYVGICMGRCLSAWFGRRVETFGAVSLYIIAFKLLSI